MKKLLDKPFYSKICELDPKLLGNRFGELQTNDVILMNERINHIKVSHGEDFKLFVGLLKTAIVDPDYVIEDKSHTGTAFYVKKLSNSNLNVVVRLALSTDKKGRKNSIMTFFRIRNTNLEKLIEKNTLIYKKD